MATNQVYSVAIARFPNVIRRTAREVSGDLVLGFAFTCVPINPTTDRITCELLNAGAWYNDAVLKSALDTLCMEFGEENIRRAVDSWCREKFFRAGAPLWAQFK